MATRPLGAQVSHMLKARGVDVIFGIPGVHNQEMYRGIEEAGISHVLARHEQGAGFMADGYARASGKPGVAYVITGPGLCNIMTPMGQAYSDSVPMLVLSSCLDETAAKRGQLHQMLDQEAAAGTVCDWSYEARTPEAAYALVDRALAEFVTQRPRTKHIQVPIAALEAAASAAQVPQEEPGTELDCPQMRTPVATAINEAKRPLFIVGGGAAFSDAGEQVVEILTKTGGASFCTYAGRGVVPGTFARNFGSYLGRPESAEIVASADLVVVVGSELAEVDLWREKLGDVARMVRIDLDPEVLADANRAELKVKADAKTFLQGLLPEIDDRNGVLGWNDQEIASARARWRAESDAERPGIAPICDVLKAALPNDTMIYSDMTQFGYVGLEVWDMEHPGHWHNPTGFGTLGYALPAAIGGCMARKGKPTVAIAGDYGFQYTVQELGAAVELGLPLPIILWDNGKLKEIEDSMTRAQIAPNAVIAHNPDFCALARAYGAYAETPANATELATAVQMALKADGPTLIYVTPEMDTA